MIEYLDLVFDIFDQTGQKAKVNKNLTISELMDEIIKEFDDLNNDHSVEYALFLKGNPKPLDKQKSLESLNIQMFDELVFQYASGTPRDVIEVKENCNAYVLVESLNENIKIEWQPAIIGRPDNDPTHNKLLAINLQSAANGMSVSRKHAQILEEDHHYFIEPLSTYNPTYLNDETLPIEGKRELFNNDLLFISKARIKLVFTICPE
ncbi:MAG: hypothetical protein CL609_10755 [Anaerolineaceae bacterium]|nr:hypothetical protein [Anaerolineaceae bacterium]